MFKLFNDLQTVGREETAGCGIWQRLKKSRRRRKWGKKYFINVISVVRYYVKKINTKSYVSGILDNFAVYFALIYFFRSCCVSAIYHER